MVKNLPSSVPKSPYLQWKPAWQLKNLPGLVKLSLFDNLICSSIKEVAERERLKQEFALTYETFSKLLGLDSGSLRLWARKLQKEGKRGAFRYYFLGAQSLIDTSLVFFLGVRMYLIAVMDVFSSAL